LAEATFTIAPGDVPVFEEEPLPPVGASGPPLAQNTDHCEQSLNARTEDYRGLPRFEELLTIFCEQIQEIEDAIFQVALDSVDTAVGVQLDGFGSIVGADRQGLSDDDYRALIRATIKANNSEGTIPDLYGVVLAALAAAGPGFAALRIYPPAGFIIEILNPPAFNEILLHGLLVRATAAGVRGITKVSAEAVGTRLRFSDATSFPTFAIATGLDDSLDPGKGGTFVAAYDERTG
jgi:hypothetical protein